MALNRDMHWDETWKSLPAVSQALYYVILAEPWTTKAGIAPITVRRWSHQFGDQSSKSVTVALDALEAGGRAILDRNPVDPYVLLPRFLYDNGTADKPNSIASAIKSARECRSAMIREAFAAVVADLPGRESSLAIGIAEKRARRAPISPALRLSVYLRDDWTCLDCGRRIPPTGDEEARGERAPFDDSAWLELDHVHPHSDGGEDTYENLRALCSRCNRVKGARRILTPPLVEVF